MSMSLMEKPKRFGRYRLLGHIADGGMASVHLAQLGGNRAFKKWVAMKVVHDRHAGDERFESMFLAEASLAAQIDHPNVAQVFDCGSVEGICYLAMEFLSGQTLHALLRRTSQQEERIPPPIVARVIAQTALGLHAAHELRGPDGNLGIVHRDVSPQNIFVLYSGQTKLMDFGIAYASKRESHDDLTAVGEVKGKFAYMSPEQLVKDPLDRRSDIFALGIVAWEAATGTRLFKRRSEAETAMAVMNDPIPRASEVVPDLPPSLDEAIARALHRDRDDRWSTAQEFAEALEAYIMETGDPSGAPRVARYMDRLFPSDRDEHTTTLRRAAVLLDEFEDSGTSVPNWSQELRVDFEQLDDTRAAPVAGKSARRVGLAVGLVALLALGAWWLGGSAPDPSPSAPTPTAGPARAESVATAPASIQPSGDDAVPTQAAVPPLAAEAAVPAQAEPVEEPSTATAPAAPAPTPMRPWRPRPRREAPVAEAPERPAPMAEAPSPTGPRPMTEFE